MEYLKDAWLILTEIIFIPEAVIPAIVAGVLIVVISLWRFKIESTLTKKELQFIKVSLLDRLDHHYLLDGDNEMQELLDAPPTNFRGLRDIQKYKDLIRKIQEILYGN